ncbi:protein-L-isoaspartate O-methyltransferase [Salipiger marinus]|jgi:protein-L-isoaspartate(D-aspartate) O-methyltransferase|uniref:protein-L-isoaspartate O-methyltransferase family protein n=1 Tax=Salipiger marinus TaxID=555512 RepID=UPI000E85501B|nr:protein-L-isoaspartate O-methyltransferase [Salipiger manganoxidans]MCD1620000.1 protein-L-isoaspartate O-methyltransferase [Salipiger manganoxidans]MEB3420946.1 protein-L-isoaspartate O-methyltransferase [Salipiger manganoxidans]HBM57884.1 protein-L-isoaspartate O-methyltransferase [Citreicella sp.]HBT02607.1 protein-L-isoaspartate O-methyltransferase [Citreicella sp.]|tara:strand:+ start:115 stop:765 length:651 start_codon:yes stop_codon:yes gene_type:complete
MTDFAMLRRMMVDTQVRPSDVTKFPIIDSMLRIPREQFVPAELRDAAYAGRNVDLGGGRVVLDPRTFAKMLDALNLGANDLVLDLGAGLGYSAAVIARIAEAVVAVEDDEARVSEAQGLLSDHADNVILQTGPLAEGAPQHGPYDAILVEGGVQALPDTIAAQLKEGGRIACIFMEGALGTVRVGWKIDGAINWRFSFNATAPVLPGFEHKTEFAL